MSTKQVAILFEGSWFFVKDPADNTRILALCPYTNAADHTCTFGFWDDNQIAGPHAKGAAGTMREGDTLWVDVFTDQKKTATFQTLFETAHTTYHFPYLKSTDASQPLKLSDTTGMRQVSISMPDSLLPDALATNATIYLKKDSINPISCSTTESVSSYVVFAFLYDYEDFAKVDMSNGFFNQTVFKPTENPLPAHLIFRVAGFANEDEDCAEEHSHIIGTFNMLRKMVYITGKSSTSEGISQDKNLYCDVAIYPTQGKPLAIEPSEIFSADELGLGLPIGDYSSCAAGPFAADLP